MAFFSKRSSTTLTLVITSILAILTARRFYQDYESHWHHSDWFMQLMYFVAPLFFLGAILEYRRVRAREKASA